MDDQVNREVTVWDPLQRIFHWSLVFFFLLAYILEDDFPILHSYAGYSVFLLVAFRLLWGVIGTTHARFSHFMTSPVGFFAYLRQLPTGRARRYLGHNPAGAAMIVALLLSLSVTALSGMVLFSMEGSGPFSGTAVSLWPAPLIEKIHHISSTITLIMIVLHVGGVLLSSFLHRENLIKAMITGRKTL